MIASASKVVVLADHTKVGNDYFARFGEVSDIDLLVTDSGLSDGPPSSSSRPVWTSCAPSRSSAEERRTHVRLHACRNRDGCKGTHPAVR